jgi:RNA polymerase sigma-70 factor (ECF subfamily)
MLACGDFVSYAAVAMSHPESFPGTSLSLLERARKRDGDAWQRLTQLYGPLVSFWVRRAEVADTDAADLVQEVWQSAAGALERFERTRESGTFRGWLWTITRNKIADHFRKSSDTPSAAGGTEARRLLEAVPEQEPPDDTGVEEHALLHRALALIQPEFEERTWQAFWRLTVDSQGAATVGQELGMAANAVHQAKFRVLKRLREEMAALGVA